LYRKYIQGDDGTQVDGFNHQASEMVETVVRTIETRTVNHEYSTSNVVEVETIETQTTPVHTNAADVIVVQ
jgi:hypothetical protein